MIILTGVRAKKLLKYNRTCYNSHRFLLFMSCGNMKFDQVPYAQTLKLQFVFAVFCKMAWPEVSCLPSFYFFLLQLHLCCLMFKEYEIFIKKNILFHHVHKNNFF